MTEQAPKQQAKPKKKNSKLKQRFLAFSIKLGITALCMGSFYAIYLDGKIRSKMDGKFGNFLLKCIAKFQQCNSAGASFIN